MKIKFGEEEKIMEALDGIEAKAPAMATRARVKQVMELRRETANALIDMKESIQPLLLTLPPRVDEVRARHSRWLQEYEIFLSQHDEYIQYRLKITRLVR